MISKTKPADFLTSVPTIMSAFLYFKVFLTNKLMSNMSKCGETCMYILYLLGSVLLIFGINSLQHFAFINLPHWIHTCRNRCSTLEGKTCEDASALHPPPSLHVQLQLSWADFGLFPCVRFSADYKCRKLVQSWGPNFVMLLLLVRLCLSH